MLFSSIIFFFLFLPLTITSLYFISKKKLYIRFIFIIILSLLFYGYYNPALILLLIFSIVINFLFSQLSLRLFSSFYLAIIIIFNLLLLFYFKYSYFFISEIIQSRNLIDNNIYWQYGLPIGISFFTFQQIAFQVDLYQKKIKSPNFFEYFAYVSFFPQLIAGPIVKYQYFINQIYDKFFLRLNIENFSIGLCIFGIGLFKKIIMADSLSHYVNLTYDNCFEIECARTDFFITTFLYSFQIYFDFSAYSDMAIGVAKMLGVNLPINFNSPYKSRSLIDFWRRWHITLSNFLRDYLYIQLGGNKVKYKIYKYRNILITMIIGGVWHGAGFNFIFWGLIHGIGLCVNHFFRNYLIININHYFSVLLTFIFVSFTWIFFRAESLEDSIFFINKILLSHETASYIYRADNIINWLPLTILSIVIIFLLPNTNKIIAKYLREIWYLKYFFILILIFAIVNINRAKKFIYYEF